MIAVSTIFLLFVLSICNAGVVFHEPCPLDTIEFATKVENSSFVVLGKSLEKALDHRSDTMFYVIFEVDCIFKGLAIPRHINITHAGQVEGKTYCQDFPLGRGHTIAFLERNPFELNNTEAFIPADFVEIPYVSNVTDELLLNTCGLHQLLPLESSASLSDVCPIVSTAPQCIPMLELTSLGSGLYAHVIPGGSEHIIDNIRSKSGAIPVDVDTKNAADSINLSILLILMAMIYVRLN